MKNALKKVFGFILNPLEKGDEEFLHNKLGRKILLVMGFLFSALSAGIATTVLNLENTDPTYLFPSVIFGCAGLYCWVVGLLGSDRAVAKVWGSRS